MGDNDEVRSKQIQKLMRSYGELSDKEQAIKDEIDLDKLTDERLRARYAKDFNFIEKTQVEFDRLVKVYLANVHKRSEEKVTGENYSSEEVVKATPVPTPKKKGYGY